MMARTIDKSLVGRLLFLKSFLQVHLPVFCLHQKLIAEVSFLLIEAFVEVSLLNSNGGEISCAKTGVCKGSFHPTFEETFYFPAIEFELSGLTLIFSVYYKKFRKKELIGWFGIGRESTGDREQLHWDEMIDARGEAIKGWYLLG